MRIIGRAAILVSIEGKNDGFLDQDEHGTFTVDEHMPTRLIWDNPADAAARITSIITEAKVVETAKDGVRSPTHDIRRILGLGGDSVAGAARLHVVKFTLEEAGNPVMISGKIEKPTGFTYG